MKAVILVGGFGTRLRPLTLSVPKQMLPLGGATMVQRVVEHLGGLGVEEVILSLGYQPEVFLREFPEGEIAGVPVRYAVEPVPLDTGGAIRSRPGRRGSIVASWLSTATSSRTSTSRSCGSSTTEPVVSPRSH